MSNELKVTGGEWRTESFLGDWVIYNDADELVETVYSGEANARLLAASKKLYEALIVAEEVIFTFEGEKLRDKFPLTLADIRAALAAARGEDQ